MMDFLSLDVAALFQTKLTQRVSRCVTVTDTLPCPSVPALCLRTAVIFFVAPGFESGVFLTKSAIRQIGTAGIFDFHPVPFPPEALPGGQGTKRAGGHDGHTGGQRLGEDMAKHGGYIEFQNSR